jgi:hypothetical protein
MFNTRCQSGSTRVPTCCQRAVDVNRADQQHSINPVTNLAAVPLDFSSKKAEIMSSTLQKCEQNSGVGSVLVVDITK